MTDRYALYASSAAAKASSSEAKSAVLDGEAFGGLAGAGGAHADTDSAATITRATAAGRNEGRIRTP